MNRRIFAIAMAVVTLPLAAEERTEESFIPNYAVAGSYVNWAADADFSDAAGSMSFLEYGVEANVPVYMKEGFRLTAGAKYRRTRLDFSGVAPPFGSGSLDLDRLDLPVNLWGDLSERWKLWVSLQPGWHSDFESVTSADFILTSLALLSYKWNDSWTVAFGAYYSQDLGEERLLPALGVIIEPDPQWSLALTFPRAQVAFAPDRDWLFTGKAVLSGASWNITNPDGGEDVNLNYRAIRAGVGIDRRLSGPWWAYLDTGLEFGRELEIEGGTDGFSEDLESTSFVMGGVKLRF
ncbi:MAG: hypothetical protein HKN23_17630 [Verrucomicrobiales bacterium]|nr:hypothetical protein [Verrucomicrobiales bacterium]